MTAPQFDAEMEGAPMKRCIVVLAVVSFMVAVPVMGQQPYGQPYGPIDTVMNYGGNCVDRLDTGLNNTVLGWTDVLVYPAKGAVQRDACTPISNVVYPLPVGVGMGAASAVGRTVKGLFQTATFLIPKNDFWDSY